jgi:hypothetical protein
VIPNVFCTIDDIAVDMADWRASSTVNGGYDTFSCRIPARQAVTSHVGQGAPVRLFLGSGRVVWEGKLGVDPRVTDDSAFITASGPKVIAERSVGRRMYQGFGPSLWAPDSGTPFNGTPSPSIHATTEPSGLHWTVNQGETVASGAESALVCWIPGVKIRRVRGTVVVNGAGADYSLRIYSANGPDGARTLAGVNAFVLLDQSFGSGADMIVIGLRRNGAAHTRTDTLDVLIRNIRVNDLTLADGLSASQVASDLGSRLGLDVSGIPTGPPTDTITGSVSYQMFGAMTGAHVDEGVGGQESVGGQDTSYQIETAAVSGSALNVMPIDHQGSDAALLDSLSYLIDWRWRIGANVSGNGHLLDFGPWGPMWDLSLQEGTKADLAPQEKFNFVRVPYTNASGKPVHFTKKAEPDPLYRFNEKRVYEEALQNIQKDDKLAKAVADILLSRVTQRRYAGRLEVAYGRASDGRQSTYELQAGDVARIGGWGPNDAQTLRISQVEMSSSGVTLGVDGEQVSVAHMLALLARRAEHKPLAHVHAFTKTAGTRTYVYE